MKSYQLPQGFLTGGINCGIKKKDYDLGLIFFEGRKTSKAHKGILTLLYREVPFLGFRETGRGMNR